MHTQICVYIFICILYLLRGHVADCRVAADWCIYNIYITYVHITHIYILSIIIHKYLISVAQGFSKSQVS